MKGWSAFPGRGQPKVLVADGDRVSHALSLYNPSSLAGRVIKRCFCLMPDAVARLLLPRVDETPASADFEAFIAAHHGPDCRSGSIYPGTPGPDRKSTMRLRCDDGSLRFIKIGESDAARRLIRNERDALQRAHALALEGVVLPEVSAFEDSDEYTALSQGSAQQSLIPRTRGPDASDYCFLEAMILTSRSSTPLQHLLDAHGWSDDVLTGPARDTWNNVIACLETAFTGDEVLTAYSHGDYVRWNTAYTADGELYVFDWEYGMTSAALDDLLHCHFMPARLVDGMPARKICGWLADLCSDPGVSALLENCGISREALGDYLLLYLLRIMLRERQRYDGADPYLTECAHRLLVQRSHPGERRRVLVGAYACEPDQGSEPGVGWHMARAIAEHDEVWVITRSNNRACIEAELEARPHAHLHFAYADLPRWAAFWKRGGRGIRLYYYLWQLAAWRTAKRLQRKHDFDLGHHVTFVNDYVYTFMCLLGIPYVWGPLGSNPPWPASLSIARKALLRDRLRCVVQAGMRCCDPLYWLSAKRASLVLGIDEAIGRQFPLNHLAADRFMVHHSIGVENEALHEHHDHDGDRCEILMMGKLLPIKGYRLAVLAFARSLANAPHAHLTLIGSGPERDAIDALVDELGITQQVTMIDLLPRTEALQRLTRADVFLYPSFEGSGMVTLEAMAASLPVAGLDFAGVGSMVCDDCGIRVPVGSLDVTIDALADALVKLASDNSLRRSMGASARSHVARHYLWEQRAHSIQRWYERALSATRN